MFADSLLSEIRDRFAHVESDPFTGARIYLESAGGSLTLLQVIDTVRRWTAVADNAARDNPTSREVDRTIHKGLEQLRVLLGAHSGVVALAESTSANAFRTLEALCRSAAAEGWGGNVVTTNADHPALYDATRYFAEQYGLEWRVAEIDPRAGRVDPREILSRVDNRTAVVAVIHSSNILGTTNDVQTIVDGTRAANPRTYTVIDGAQHLPHHPVDVGELGCDVYLTSSYKTFGKAGASGVYLSDRAADLPHPRLAGKPSEYWELGTREVAGYASWSAVVDYLLWLGAKTGHTGGEREILVGAMSAIRDHERGLSSLLLHGDTSIPGLVNIPGCTVYGDTDDLDLREPVAVFSLQGTGAAETVAALGQRGIIVHQRIADAYSRHTLEALGVTQCVRVSLCHYNTPGDVHAFLRALGEIAS